MTQRSSSYGHDSKDDQPEPLCALYDECPVKVLDIENDDTQPLLHHAAMQRLQKGSSRRQSRDQSLSSGGKFIEKNKGWGGKSVRYSGIEILEQHWCRKIH